MIKIDYEENQNPHWPETRYNRYTTTGLRKETQCEGIANSWSWLQTLASSNRNILVVFFFLSKFASCLRHDRLILIYQSLIFLPGKWQLKNSKNIISFSFRKIKSNLSTKDIGDGKTFWFWNLDLRVRIIIPSRVHWVNDVSTEVKRQYVQVTDLAFRFKSFSLISFFVHSIAWI